MARRPSLKLRRTGRLTDILSPSITTDNQRIARKYVSNVKWPPTRQPRVLGEFRRDAPECRMNLVDCLLGHDAWTTKRILDICAKLSVAELDRDFDIGHRTLRGTLDHIIHNMEIWSALMAQQEFERSTDQTISGMAQRLANAESRLRKVAQDVAESNAWNETWYDHLDRPPGEKRFGTSIAHLITHSMHHRAQLLYMLRLCGVRDLPEGDVFSWEAETAGMPNP